jgi:hypothetical protein
VSACGVQELGIYCDLRVYFDAALSGLPDLNVFKNCLNMFKSYLALFERVQFWWNGKSRVWANLLVRAGGRVFGTHTALRQRNRGTGVSAQAHSNAFLVITTGTVAASRWRC